MAETELIESTGDRTQPGAVASSPAQRLREIVFPDEEVAEALNRAGLPA